MRISESCARCLYDRQKEKTEGGGSPWDIYQDYIEGKKEIRDINMEYMERYRQDRQIR